MIDLARWEFGVFLKVKIVFLNYVRSAFTSPFRTCYYEFRHWWTITQTLSHWARDIRSILQSQRTEDRCSRRMNEERHSKLLVLTYFTLRSLLTPSLTQTQSPDPESQGGSTTISPSSLPCRALMAYLNVLGFRLQGVLEKKRMPFFINSKGMGDINHQNSSA